MVSAFNLIYKNMNKDGRQETQTSQLVLLPPRVVIWCPRYILQR